MLEKLKIVLLSVVTENRIVLIEKLCVNKFLKIFLLESRGSFFYHIIYFLSITHMYYYFAFLVQTILVKEKNDINSYVGEAHFPHTP